MGLKATRRRRSHFCIWIYVKEMIVPGTDLDVRFKQLKGLREKVITTAEV